MFLLQWLMMLVIRLVLIVAGLVVVPLALPFREMAKSASDGRGIWVLPDWAWLWSNDFDGTLGDKRGWWDAHAPFDLGKYHWFSQFWWLAIRNPVNNLRRTVVGSCPVAECDLFWKGNPLTGDRPGGSGWLFVEAVHRGTGQRWHGFYYVREITERRAFVFRVGFKMVPGNGRKEPPKGFTFKINPWKAI